MCFVLVGLQNKEIAAAFKLVFEQCQWELKEETQREGGEGEVETLGAGGGATEGGEEEEEEDEEEQPMFSKRVTMLHMNADGSTAVN